MHHPIIRRQLLLSLILRLSACTALVFAAGSVSLQQSSGPHLASTTVSIGNGALTTVGFDEVVELGIGAEMVGFTWDGIAEATIDVRAFSDGSWGEWLTLEGDPLEGPDSSSPEAAEAAALPQVSVGPAWLGHDVKTVEVRVAEGAIAGFKVHGIDSEPPTTSGVSLAAEASGEVARPFIIPRAQWGADESYRQVNCSGSPAYASQGVKFAVVHHTAGSNSYGARDSASIIRGIYYFHVFTNGWCDIGYNFLVDRYGQVFEGRAGGINQAVIGGHAGGFNGGSTGISVLGSFDSAGVPWATQQALQSLLAWKLAYHHVDPNGVHTHTVAESTCNCQRWPVGTAVTIPNIVGHGDVDFTGCPGANLYALLPQIRASVAAQIAAQGWQAEWTCQWDQGAGSAPSLVAPIAGRVDFFTRAADGRLEQRTETGGAVLGPFDLGGYLTSDPDASSWGLQRIDVFARGGDNALWTRAWTGSSWTGWSSLGGILSSAPSAVSWGPGRVDVFACGADGGLWQRTLNSGTWGGWTNLGGILMSAPEVTSTAPGQLDVVARAANGAVYYRRFANGSWASWQSASGIATAGPAAGSALTNSLDVFARGGDWGLHAAWRSGATWSGFYPLGGVLVSDPDVASPFPGHYIVMAQGTDGRYWQRYWNASYWSGWVPVT